MTAPKRGDAEYRTLCNALKTTTPPCSNDWRYTLDAEALNDDEKAQMHNVCQDCPLNELCRTYAKAARPSGGYWAGRYWGRKERNPA